MRIFFIFRSINTRLTRAQIESLCVPWRPVFWQTSCFICSVYLFTSLILIDLESFPCQSGAYNKPNLLEQASLVCWFYYRYCFEFGVCSARNLLHRCLDTFLTLFDSSSWPRGIDGDNGRIISWYIGTVWNNKLLLTRLKFSKSFNNPTGLAQGGKYGFKSYFGVNICNGIRKFEFGINFFSLIIL